MDLLHRVSPAVVWHDEVVTPSERTALLRQPPLVIWFTGLSGSGKSALSDYMARRLHDRGLLTYVLDGDNLRHGLNGDLAFSVADRHENVRRIAHLADLMYEAGLIALVACISPLRAERDFARSLLPKGRFVEVFVDAPLSVCEQRDAKGLYGRVRRGEITNFTGIDSPYEAPANPEIIIDSARYDIAQCGAQLETFLEQKGLLEWPTRE